MNLNALDRWSPSMLAVLGLDDQVAATGARLEVARLDPMADLIRVQRLAVLIAHAQGRNPDTPRNLTRSVILS